jgi:hypothetical protein
MAITQTAAKTVRRRLATALGLAALTATAGAVFATPASASTNCAAGYHCVMYNNVTGLGLGQGVNDNSASASNSSTGGYESHFYLHRDYDTFLFCVNPGSEVNILPSGQRNQASSLLLRPRTTVPCY